MAASKVDSGLDAEFLQEVSAIIKTMGHPDRLKIVELLRGEEYCVSEIQKMTGLTQPVTSQHLRQMYHQGILTNRRKGHQVIYTVDNPLIDKMLNCLVETQTEMKG